MTLGRPSEDIISQARTPYDDVPYGSFIHPQTHPERLFTIGRLFGMAPPDPQRTRVLELGCGSGANLVAMAFGLPDADFVGIDLALEHVRTGREEIETLGLTNVRLEHASIEDVNEEDFGRFDYVICHGVYSWVSDQVRRKILDICSQRLTPSGIAHVSYNALPGWHLVRTVRDMMRYHGQLFEEPEEKARQARALLEFATASWEGQSSAYAELMRTELGVLSEMRDSYLIHDHLAEINEPVYFHQFIDAARRSGLDYLADAELHSMLAENLPDQVAGKLREIDDIVRMEQYMDFLRGRRFRNTLLCRKEQRLERDLGNDRLRPFFVSLRCQPTGDLDSALEEGAVLELTKGSTTLRVRDRACKLAMAILLRERGRPLAYGEWIERTADQLSEQPDAVRDRLEAELEPCRLLFADLLEISSLPPRFVTEVPERPEASRLARSQAARGVSVANLRHERLNLGEVERSLVQAADGSRTVGELESLLSKLAQDGELELGEGGRADTEGAKAVEEVGAYCRSALDSLAVNALLVAPE